MGRFGAAAQHVVSSVREYLGELVATFGTECGDKIRGNENVYAKPPSICLDTAGDVDRVADHGELKLIVVADITMDHVAVVNSDRHANGVSAVSMAALVPRINGSQNVECAARRIAGVLRTRQGWAKSRHQAIAQILIDDTVVREYGLAEDRQEFSQKGDDGIRIFGGGIGGKTNHVDEKNGRGLIPGDRERRIGIHELVHQLRRKKSRQVGARSLRGSW